MEGGHAPLLRGTSIQISSDSVHHRSSSELLPEAIGSGHIEHVGPIFSYSWVAYLKELL